ncbi:hypothetical protein AMATHDRAFT_11331 [Amanita thiersii Skay4041]|uniref:Retrotransposon gag domain-containing protein n=1 Tax=Amanita thiersii Skay4041 TaxID=703135 RepID=A0A2A9N5R8_9AGAR|nr:hypothetical protein AMATHDRAFT_11331 [Amanita thiersii Skay4041]
MDPILYALLPFFYLFKIIFFLLRMMVGGGTGGTDKPGWTLEAAFAQIQQLLNAQPPPPMGTQPARSLKMATPPLYDGSMATCEAFINACQLYMTAKPHEFVNLQTKITWVLRFMQLGMAQLFRDQFMIYMASDAYWTQYLESTEPNPIKLLYADIYKAFGDPNKQATAIQEITTIKQGTKSAEEHVQSFKQCYM